MTKSDVRNMNSAPCRGAWIAIRSNNVCGKGSQSCPVVTRQCGGPSAAFPKTIPTGSGSAVSMFRRCLKTLAPEVGLEPHPELALVETIVPISLNDPEKIYTSGLRFRLPSSEENGNVAPVAMHQSTIDARQCRVLDWPQWPAHRWFCLSAWVKECSE